MFPFFLFTGGGNGGGDISPWALVALLIALPFYGFVIAAVIHFSGIPIDKVMMSWYGLPALIAVCAVWLGAVVATVILVDEGTRR